MIEQLPALIDRTEIIGDVRGYVVQALIAAAGARASLRFLEFFAANIRNPHTRGAYGRAVTDFLAWCDDNYVRSITAVQPLHVAPGSRPRRASTRRQRRSCAWRRCAICSTGW